MPVTIADLVALSKQVEADRKKLEEQEKAIAIVAEMLRDRNAVQASEPQLDLRASKNGSSTNLNGAIKEAVKHFPTEEFNVSNIETLLKTQGTPIPNPDNIRGRISSVMYELLRKKIIVRTFHGSGNVPNRYRLNRGSDKEEGFDAQTSNPSGTTFSHAGRAEANGLLS